MRISDWSSDVCSSDLQGVAALIEQKAVGLELVGLAAVRGARQKAQCAVVAEQPRWHAVVETDIAGPFRGVLERRGVGDIHAEGIDEAGELGEIGRASCRERVCPYV